MKNVGLVGCGMIGQVHFASYNSLKDVRCVAVCDKNAAGHMQIVAELVAKGEKPFIRASDSFDSMRLGFAAELSEHQGRIIKFSEV